jgi:hypothetical protein
VFGPITHDKFYIFSGASGGFYIFWSFWSSRILKKLLELQNLKEA